MVVPREAVTTMTNVQEYHMTSSLRASHRPRISSQLTRAIQDNNGSPDTLMMADYNYL